MSAPALSAVGAPADQGLLHAYLEHVAASGLSERARRDRARTAREFLGRHPDLAEWMALPVGERMGELGRGGPWPLIVHAIAAGEVRLDLDLAGAKNLAGLGRAIECADPEGFAALRRAGTALGWTGDWVETVLRECLAVVLAWHGGTAAALSAGTLEAFDAALARTATMPPSSKKAYRCRLASLRQLLYEARVIDEAPRRRPWARTIDQRLDAAPIAAPLRTVIGRYIRARAAVLRPKSVESLLNDLLVFGEYLTCRHPELASLAGLRREHIEGFLGFNRTRTWRGQRAAAGAGRTVSAAVAQSTVLSVRNLLEDTAAWGWTEAPGRRLLFAADVPKLDRPLPRALAPDIDAALMNAVAELPDLFARTGLTVLRGAGLRVGELLDLELGSVLDYGPAGTWLRVPLGKLATERMVPLDTPTLAALDEWTVSRGAHRPLPHPRTGQPADFLFTARGRRLGYTRLRNGLLAAAEKASLHGPGGSVLVVTPHQLRHTYATSLANAGMSLQALMALLGHVTPEMTMRYATLASPTLRAAYDESIGKLRRQLSLTPVGRPIVPDKVSWLSSEMLKTRVAHGYCSRHQAQGACEYANICETCENFTTAPEFAPALSRQLEDVHALKADAAERGWADEEARHDRVATAIETHLGRLQPR